MAASFSLTGSLRLDPRWTDDLNTTTVTDSARVNITFALANGDDDGEADVYWKDVRTVAGAGRDTFGFDSLPLNAFGGSGSANLAEIRVIFIRNLSETKTLQYEFDESSTVIRIAPSGSFLWFSDTDTPAPTFSDSEIRLFNPGAGSANYEIILIGVKAT